MENYAFDPNVILQVVNINNQANWISIEDIPIKSNLSSPEELVIGKEELIIAKDLLTKAYLTKKEKKVIEHLVLNKFTIKEISKEMNISLQRLYRLCRNLIKKINHAQAIKGLKNQ